MAISETNGIDVTQHINGCDTWFDGSWRACCDLHDVQFTNGGDLSEFFRSNLELGQCVLQHDPLNAVLMFTGVTLFGGLFFRWRRLKGKNLWEVIFKR